MSEQSQLIAQARLARISRANEELHEYKLASGAVRHKCFLSYHAADAEQVLKFVESFESVLITKCLGVDEDDPWIDSEDTDYIMDRIRDKYLRDSTVTVVLVGDCTWSRKYIDWEVYSSLRRDRLNRLNGLLAIQLPGASGSLPARVSDNVTRDPHNNDIGYGRYYVYPSNTWVLQNWIQDAFDARATRADLRENSRARKKFNTAC